jgi:uncharacterized membrane protein
MKFLGYIFVALIAAALIVAMLVGVAIQLIWYGFLALLVVGAVTFVMGKLKGPKRSERLEAPLDAERLPR